MTGGTTEKLFSISVVISKKIGAMATMMLSNGGDQFFPEAFLYRRAVV